MNKKESTAEPTAHPKGKVVELGGKGKATPAPKPKAKKPARKASNKASHPVKFHGF